MKLRQSVDELTLRMEECDEEFEYLEKEGLAYKKVIDELKVSTSQQSLDTKVKSIFDEIRVSVAEINRKYGELCTRVAGMLEAADNRNGNNPPKSSVNISHEETETPTFNSSDKPDDIDLD